jgi:type IV pilus assembly protein PilO
MDNYDVKDLFNLPIKIQLTVVAVFCLIIFWLAYQWDISSMKQQLASLQPQEADLKTQLQALTLSVAEVNNDIAQLPKLQDLLKQWQGQLVKPSNLPDLLNDILKKGTANQLEFQLFNPGSETKDDKYPDYSKVPISTVVIGDYHQVATFMSQVANMPEIVVIGNFQLARGQNKLYDKKEAAQAGYANRLTGEITLEVYHLAEKDQNAK